MRNGKFRILFLISLIALQGCAAISRGPAGSNNSDMSAASGSALDLAVTEIQNYALTQNLPPLPGPMNLGGNASYSFVRKGNPSRLFLEIQSRNGMVQEINLGVTDLPKVYVDSARGYLAYLNTATYPYSVAIVDFSNGIKTLSAQVTGYDFILFKGHLLVVSAFSSTVQVTVLSYDGNNLSASTPVELLAHAAGTGCFLVAEGDHVGVYVDQLDSISGIPELTALWVNESGQKIQEKVFPQYNIDPYELDSSSNGSFSNLGTLLPLYQNGDVVALRSIYLADLTGNIRMLNQDGRFAAWTGTGDILIARGKHARSIELFLAKGSDFRTETVLQQPVGYKKDIQVNGDQVSYLNFQYVQPAALVTSPLSGESYTILSQDTPHLSNASFPRASEIDYPSGNRRVPSMLSVPAGVSTSSAENKLPAIVYIHGGFESEPPHGEFMYGDTDPLVLSQLGYVVVDANWYGNGYLSRKYKTWTHRLFELEQLTPELQDIQAAGEYTKSLPFVDPNRIILMGFSYGSVLSSVYLTSTEYKAKSPYSAAILKSGFYTKKWLTSAGLRVYTSPRLAVGPTDENRSIFPQYAASMGHTVYTPQEPLTDVSAALEQLQSLNSPTPKYYGVLYSLPDSFYDQTIALQRTKNLHQIPIFITQGTGDDVSESQTFANAIAGLNSRVTTWYPNTNDHYYKADIQKELVEKVQSFVGQLGVKGN